MKAGRLSIPNDNNKANVMPRIELCKFFHKIRVEAIFVGLVLGWWVGVGRNYMLMHAF